MAPSPTMESAPGRRPRGRIDFSSLLNEQQLAAVTSEPGAALVIAGAGSGKTRTLTHRVAYLLEKGCAPHHLLLLTFTNKAAGEMLTRVGDLVPREIHKIWGGTFHAIGNRILRAHGHLIGYSDGFSIMDREDQSSLLSHVRRELGLGKTDKKSDKRFPKPSVLAEIYSLARNLHRPLEEVLQERYLHLEEYFEDIAKLQQAYEEKKLDTNSADFDDLLCKTLQLLEDHSKVRESYQDKFHAVLVDEYQDTNAVQTRLIDLFAEKHRHLMVVGDDSQSIYSWRGADFRNIMGFGERHPGSTIYKIETNYRSVPEILELANVSISANLYQFEKTLVPARRSKGRLPVRIQVRDPNQQAAVVRRRIQKIIRENGLAHNDVAVLYRAHFHSMELQMELTQCGIPFRLTSGLRFFEQAHVKDISAFMRFIANRRDEVAFRRMLRLVPGIGDVTAGRLWQTWTGFDESKNEHPLPGRFSDILLGFRVGARAQSEWRNLAYTLDELVADGRPVAPSEMIISIVEGIYYDYARTEFPNFEQRMQDIDQVQRYSEQFSTLEEFLTKLSLETNSDREPAEEKDEILLSTVHQAKGLEWPVVFVIWLTQGMFPNRKTVEDLDAIEEERRLFHVAVTRARDRLYLLQPRLRPGGHGPSHDYYQTASEFLTELPRGLMEEKRVGTAW